MSAVRAFSDVAWSAIEGRDGWQVRVRCIIGEVLEWSSYWIVERWEVEADADGREVPVSEVIAARLLFLEGEFLRHMTVTP